MEQLYLKYRPKTFDEFLGNEETKRLVLSNFSTGFPHSTLLIGPKGSGKTTLARLIANKLGCSKSMFMEMNQADMRGIDTSRAIIEDCKHPPMVGSIKVFLIDEAHKLTNDAQNALLKVLEEPPKYAYFILATTDPDKLLGTIINRLTPYRVEPLSDELIYKLIDWVVAKEEKQISQKVRQRLCEAADGCPRTVLRILSQIIDLALESDQLKIIEEQMVVENTIRDLQRCMVNTVMSHAEKWKELKDILLDLVIPNNPKDEKEKEKKEDKGEVKTHPMRDDDAEMIRRGLMTYLSKALLSSEGAKARRIADIMVIFEKPFIAGRAELILRCFKASLL